jgi:hypothetical protein
VPRSRPDNSRERGRCSGAPPRARVALRGRAPEVFNFHRTGRWSNGRLEGTNNLLGLLKRMGFGFVRAANFEARGMLLIQRPRPMKSRSLRKSAQDARSLLATTRGWGDGEHR